MPIGSIEVAFNTLDEVGGDDGWPLNVGYAGTNIFCKSIVGLVPKPGSKEITCTRNAPATPNTKTPVKIVVSDFVEITEGTNLEFHLLDI